MAFPTTLYADQQNAIDVGRGRLRVVSGVLPVLGSDWLVTVPANVLWVILHLTAQLNTSGVAGNRAVALFLDNALVTFYRQGALYTQIASQTVYYMWSRNGPGSQVTPSSQVLNANFPPIPLAAGYRLSTTTTGLLAGDQWHALFLNVQEFDV